MRYQRPGTPTPDEAYAVTAFILLYERNRGQKAKLSEKTLPKVRIELNKLQFGCLQVAATATLFSFQLLPHAPQPIFMARCSVIQKWQWPRGLNRRSFDNALRIW